jgi:hypothetical protein
MALPTQYGASQLAFIKKVRGDIDKNKSSFFQSNSWQNITPSGGRFDSTMLNVSVKKKAKLESFYVKAIASWIPHLLFSNHVPCCPHCRRNDFVAVDKGRWINSPVVLFGLHKHQYLDTWLYPCRGCGRSFAGYNKQSMQLDAGIYFGFFNFYLGHGYAVDEELYRNIIADSTTKSTAAIAKTLEKMASRLLLF